METKQSPIRHLIAGGIAGAVEATVLYPTEFVKTQLQLQSSQSTTTKLYRGPIDCARTIVRDRGVLGLYKGLSTLVIGTFAKAAIRFYTFSAYSELLRDENGQLSSMSRLLAGLGAGMTESITVVTPTETIKTQLIHDRNSARPQYRGLVHATTSIWKREGVSGLYRGVIPTTLRQGANSAIRFSVYGSIQQLWPSSSSDRTGSALSTLRSFLSGVAAGTAATLLTMPLDVVKTRLQGQDAGQYKGALDCFVRVVREEGVRALWKGTTPRLSRVMFSSGIVFAVQDAIIQWMDNR